MQKYLATSPLTMSAGAVLAMSPGQAARRVQSIKRMPDGNYLVERPVMFKAGEVFGYDGDLPKSVAKSAEKQRAEPKGTLRGTPAADAGKS